LKKKSQQLEVADSCLQQLKPPYIIQLKLAKAFSSYGQQFTAYHSILPYLAAAWQHPTIDCTTVSQNKVTTVYSS
jgi:hypothetical protein